MYYYSSCTCRPAANCILWLQQQSLFLLQYTMTSSRASKSYKLTKITEKELEKTAKVSGSNKLNFIADLLLIFRSQSVGICEEQHHACVGSRVRVDGPWGQNGEVWRSDERQRQRRRSMQLGYDRRDAMSTIASTSSRRLSARTPLPPGIIGLPTAFGRQL